MPETDPPRISPRRTDRGAGAQYADLQAGLAGAGGRRTDPAGASGNWSAEQDLCAGAEEAGLKKILRNGIMERKKSAPPYSEERREAARKFARGHNTAERLVYI